MPATAAEARRKGAQLDQVMWETRRGVPVTMPEEAVTFEKATSFYLESRKVRCTASYIERLNTATNHLYSFFGKDNRASNIEANDIERYIAARKDAGAANASINRELQLGRAIFEYAIRMDKLLRNPWKKIDYLPEPPAEAAVRLPMDEEKALGIIRRILVEADLKSPWLRPLVLMLIGLGERVGAVRQIRKKDVEGRVLTFRAANLKGGTHSRSVILPPLLCGIVEKLGAGLAPDDYLFSRLRGLSGTVKRGTPIPYYSIRNAWTRAAKSARVSPLPRLHDIRHLDVTSLLRAGVTETLTRRQVGHKTSHMTSRYSHLVAQDTAHTSAVLEGLVLRLLGGTEKGACATGVLQTRKTGRIKRPVTIAK